MQKTVVSWNLQSLADVDARGPMKVAFSGAVLPMQNAVSRVRPIRLPGIRAVDSTLLVLGGWVLGGGVGGDNNVRV